MTKPKKMRQVCWLAIHSKLLHHFPLFAISKTGVNELLWRGLMGNSGRVNPVDTGMVQLRSSKWNHLIRQSRSQAFCCQLLISSSFHVSLGTRLACFPRRCWTSSVYLDAPPMFHLTNTWAKNKKNTFSPLKSHRTSSDAPVPLWKSWMAFLVSLGTHAWWPPGFLARKQWEGATLMSKVILSSQLRSWNI